MNQNNLRAPVFLQVWGKGAGGDYKSGPIRLGLHSSVDSTPSSA